ncbi:MAG: MarR family winged helix-turn-helix transcriptional regulator [Janthinobacterium lividum]
MLMHQQGNKSFVDVSTRHDYLWPMTPSLTSDEFAAWLGFRHMVEETSLDVSRTLASTTALSGSEFGILSVLLKALPEPVRQQELADAMRWDRTRLSHQLTRMERRGWITRQKGSAGLTLVLPTTRARQEHRRAGPVLATIVRERFLSRLSRKQLAVLQEIRQALTIESTVSTT